MHPLGKTAVGQAADRYGTTNWLRARTLATNKTARKEGHMGIAHIWALFKQRFSLPLCCLGVGLVSTWTELSYIHPPTGYLNVPYELFTLFDTGTIAFALIIALTVRFAKTKQPLVSRTANLVITALLLLSATTVNLLASVTGINAPALLDCFAVVAGGGLALLFVMWFEVISHLHPTQMLDVHSAKELQQRIGSVEED